MIDRRKTVKAWRDRARKLYTIADSLRERGDHDRADQFDRAAAGYVVDANALEVSAALSEASGAAK